MNNEFQIYWDNHFPHCPPIPHLFKQRLKEFWFRIHSLPESKRYAENDSEMKEILRRQEIVFEEIIGENINVFLVCLTFNESCSKVYENKFPGLTRLLTEQSEPISIESNEFDIDFNEFIINSGYRKTTFNELTNILKGVANWELVNFFVVNPKLNRIFAPYDGGVDLVLEDSDLRDEFRNKYKRWLSTHPKGY